MRKYVSLLAVLAMFSWACIAAPPSDGRPTSDVGVPQDTGGGEDVSNPPADMSITSDATIVDAGRDASADATQSMDAASGDWDDLERDRRVLLEISPAGFEGALLDFPTVIRFDLDTISMTEEIGSESIDFYTRDGQQIPFETAVWANGRAIIWLLLPQIQAGVANQVWLYWSTAGAPPPGNRAVWAEDFVGVFHFDGNDLSQNSVKDQRLAPSCLGCQPATGVVGLGLDASMGGLAGEMPADLLVGPNKQLTVSAWYRPTGPAPDGPLVYAESFCVGWQTALVQSENTIYSSYLVDELVSSSDPPVSCPSEQPRDEAITGLANDSTGHHVVLKIDRVANTMKLIVDGGAPIETQLLSQGVPDGVNSTPQFRIGMQGRDFADVTLTGATIDEVMVLDTVVSQTWVLAHHSNIREWTDVQALGEVESIRE